MILMSMLQVRRIPVVTVVEVVASLLGVAVGVTVDSAAATADHHLPSSIHGLIDPTGWCRTDV